MINGELIVDNFAGGGGASTGIELAAMVRSNLPELCVAERMPNITRDRMETEENGQLAFA